MLLFAVLFLIAFWFIGKPADDTAVFHTLLADFAEETAVDCGIFTLDDNPKVAYRCALSAHQIGNGFFVQIQQQGIDSDIADGWVAMQNGNVLQFNYDSDPSGGSQTGAVVYQSSCVNPQLTETEIKCSYFNARLRIPIR